MESPESSKIPFVENPEITSKVQAASSIEELIQTLKSIPQIQGSSPEPYTGTGVAETIELYINNECAINKITRSNGIRDKVLSFIRKPQENIEI